MIVVSRRAFFWCCFLYLIGGLIWGYIIGHYVGFEDGALDANKKWLEAIELYMAEPPPPCNCDPMPVYEGFGPKEWMVTYEHLQEVS